ncbi:YpdA family putative bacillithiol disulfide reductase [Oceanobacillus massiliensis]|uniref:YpdA family putative bacillithiol disulfide reductase n=1 Tax=Oceanobacillus massiliensis TaxID=1465765 RepID=UPI0002888AF4|nr:YpdA family putative bacillithiol disulfide reductase [Oceanobacillus massiliensis]
MQKEKVIIIGGGPCGMSAAIELKKLGINPLIIEKGNVVNTIHNFPTHQTFFSSSEKLELGDMAFINEKQKPVRIQALSYYREVAKRMKLRMNTYERAISISKSADDIQVSTKLLNGETRSYIASELIIATGYYDQPNTMNIPGEDKSKVMHYFKEGHPYYDKDVVVIGGKNSAVDAALELHRAGAHVTVLYRGGEYSKSIKPWIIPEFKSLVNKGIINMIFHAQVVEIKDDKVIYNASGQETSLKNDFVFAMTGYRPDYTLLIDAGIQIDKENGKPDYNPNTYETNVDGIYIAGVVAAGYNNNEIFIENGRFHGEAIAKSIHKG